MLDQDLASLYGVASRVLIQAVKRNLDRFPDDFMLQLTWDEADALRSRFVILERPAEAQAKAPGRGQHRKYPPYAFTEQGVAMLSSVLRSDRAVQVNIEVMRAFVRMRQILTSHADLARKLDALEKKYDTQFKAVFDAIRELMTPPPAPPHGKFGFARDRIG
jgi:phage regulator Rha-like protein